MSRQIQRLLGISLMLLLVTGGAFPDPARAQGGLDWFETKGSRYTDAGNDVAVDGNGGVYVTGSFQGNVNFDDDSYTESSNGLSDFFVVKYSSAGAPQWSKVGGGTGYDEGVSIATDEEGGIYVTGYFEGDVDFDGDGSVDLSSTTKDIFVVKYSSISAFQWAHALSGPSAYDEGRGVATDEAGNVYVTGYFRDSLDVNGDGKTDVTGSGFDDMFVAKYNADGTLQWIQAADGSSSDDSGEGVTVSPSGTVYVAGRFASSSLDFDGDGTAEATNVSGFDGFLAAYSPAGTFQWAQAVRGANLQNALSVAVDDLGNVYLTGQFESSPDFDGDDKSDASSIGGEDIYLAQYSSGGMLQWVKGAGSPSTNEGGFDVSTDGASDVYVVGRFVDRVDFDGNGNGDVFGDGGADIFVAKYGSAGAFRGVQGIVVNGFTKGYGVAADASGNAYVTGYFENDADFDGDGTAEASSNDGSDDIFLVRYDAASLPVELTSFDAVADEGRVRLSWQTASETGNAGFEVQQQSLEERPKGGRDGWRAVGFVESKAAGGTSTDALSYRYRTGALPADTYRFRLRQVDRDGSASFSEAVEARLGLAGRYELSAVYPNPSPGAARLKLSVAKAQAVRVAVYDLQGRRVGLAYEGTLPKGKVREISIGREQLASGMYVVWVTGETFQAERSVVIAR